MSDASDPETIDWRAEGLRRVLLGGGCLILILALIGAQQWWVGRLPLWVFGTIGVTGVVWLVSGLVTVRKVERHLLLPLLVMLGVTFLCMVVVGFASGAVMSCFAAVVFAAAFASRRMAFLVGGSISLGFVAMGALVSRGIISFPARSPFVLVDASNWLRTGTSMVILLALAVGTLHWLLRQLRAELDDASRAAAALEEEQRRREAAELEYRETERALTLSRDAEAIGRLAGGIAHDFNNQLQVFLGWTDTLLAMPPGEREEMLAAALEDIRRAAAQGAELSRQLGSMSSAQMQGPGTTSIGAFLEAQSDTYRRVLPQGVGVEVDTSEEIHANINEGRMHQVLLNLVLNARDAMPGGGTIHIRARLASPEESPEGMGEGDAERWLELEVSDEGSGMDEEVRRRIFEPFFTTKGVSGTGLGLANVYGIIKAAGGSVRVDSRVGVGTTFRLYLPTADPFGAAPAARRPASLEAGGTVLLVDDREDVRIVFREALEGAGFTVVIGQSADEGMESLESAAAPFDLLVTDAIMPGKSVLELIDAFATRWPAAPILICSGHIEEDLLRRGIRAGDYAFMAKPFRIQEFVETVQGLVAA